MTFSPNAAAYGCIPLEHPFWPLTYRFIVSTPYGMSRTNLSINVPRFEGELEAAGKFGVALWGLTVAMATSDECWLTGLEVIQWKLAPIAVPVFISPVRGLAPLSCGARAHSGCIMAHSGVSDGLAARRVVIPGLPTEWSASGFVTSVGLRALEGVAKVLVMGCGGEIGGCPSELIVAYDGLLEPAPGNLSGVAFRHCEYLVPVQHTTRAPD